MKISGNEAQAIFKRLAFLLVLVGAVIVFINTAAGFFLCLIALFPGAVGWSIPRVEAKGYPWTMALVAGLLAPVAGIFCAVLPTRSIPRAQPVSADRYRGI